MPTIFVTPEQRSSGLALYWELAESVQQHKTHVYKHEILRESFILRDEAIPLPRSETILAWNILFRPSLWPFPPIHIEGHAALAGAFRPASYGIMPESILLPLSPIQVAYGPYIAGLNLLATSGFHFLSAHPEYHFGLRPIPLLQSEYFVGMTFVMTDSFYKQSWCDTRDSLTTESVETAINERGDTETVPSV